MNKSRQTRIAIIGGAGKMGRWFADFLLRDGKRVVISGRNQTKLFEVKRQLGVEVATNNVEALKDADFILVSVPIESFEKVVAEIGPFVHPEQSVIDVTSVKVLPVETMHKYIKTGVVLGAHPLFGPGARDVTNHNFVLTPTNDAEAALAKRIKNFLETKGARVTLMSPQEHDEMMSIILGLAHFIALVSADTLLTSDKLEPMAAIGGITYKVLLTLVESVLSEDPEFYASIQMSLPYVTNVERIFQRKAEEWADLVANKDREKFIQRMKDLSYRLSQHADLGEAYADMYKIAENRQGKSGD